MDAVRNKGSGTTRGRLGEAQPGIDGKRRAPTIRARTHVAAIPSRRLPCPCPIRPQITEEQRLKAELESQTEALRQRIAEQRVAMGGINASAEASVKVGGAWASVKRAAGRMAGRLASRCAAWPCPAVCLHPPACLPLCMLLQPPLNHCCSALWLSHCTSPQASPSCYLSPPPNRPSAASASWRTACSRPACGTTRC